MNRQRGGTFLGLVIGIVLGLGVALGVAIYVTQVPVPFINKGQTRSAEQDAAEARKNKDWDPNQPLYGKHPARQSAAGVVGEDGKPAEAASKPEADTARSDKADKADKAVEAKVKPEVKPAEVKPTEVKSEAKAEAKTEPKAAEPRASAKPVEAAKSGDAKATSDPLGDLARSKSGEPAVDNFQYFVQVGAFKTTEEAEAQKARIAMMGWEARITEREQGGRTVFRVRLGPFAKRDDADRIKEKLDGAGIDNALVRAPR